MKKYLLTYHYIINAKIKILERMIENSEFHPFSHLL